MDTFATGRNGFRRLAALVCLVALGFGPAKFLPPVFALMADAEGSHIVRIEEDSKGATRVVLSHAPRPARLEDQTSRRGLNKGKHYHGWASQAVCLLSGVRTGQTDHVACFASGGMTEVELKASQLRTLSSGCNSGDAVRLQAGSALAILSPLMPGASRGVAGIAQNAAGLCRTTARPECLRSNCLQI